MIRGYFNKRTGLLAALQFSKTAWSPSIKGLYSSGSGGGGAGAAGSIACGRAPAEAPIAGAPPAVAGLAAGL